MNAVKPVTPAELESASTRLSTVCSTLHVLAKQGSDELGDAMALLSEYVGQIAIELSGMHQRHSHFVDTAKVFADHEEAPK